MSSTGADIRLTDLVHRYTDLSEDDLHILLEVSHSLPFIGDLEGGDTYINVLTRDRESLVVAQYRHPDYDLYHRDIVGEIELRENEPAVYRALEQGTPGRGLIGIIDEGRLVVRHTVSSIRNADGRIIGSLTHEFPNARPNTDPVRIITKDGFSTPFEEPFQQSISYHRSRIRELEKELEYQEALVREVHHRVKNNLQTIISLIGLEAAQTKNADVKAFARTITRHIQSVSLTYEMLSRSDSDAVNVKYLLTKLIENLHNYMLTLQPTISITIEGDNVKLPANLASTVALIVNELLQNSLKYAFFGRKSGEIHIQIQRGDDFSTLVVSDNGCGYDLNAAPVGTGLGMRLIRSLVESSLHGALDVKTDMSGTSTRFTVRNPDKTELFK
ncbi:MAG: histidine kinase N-terminal domain-containing protein [Lachnospiraceae bacterium]|nr:histidine kinase N-terminal domain-containing protein [Lachnospiraceae bacterium]